MAAPIVVSVGTPIGGKSQAEWSAIWWQWALSYPFDQNPIVDETGGQAFRGDFGSVFLLAGTFGDSVTRTVTVRPDQTLFFPLVNAITTESFSFYGPTEEGLRQDVAEFLGEGRNMFLTWNGVSLLSSEQILANQRFQSPLFTVDTVFGEPFGPEKAIADGYWVALTGLPLGTHTLRFGGTAQSTGIYANDPPFSQDVTYIITVTPEPTTVVVLGLLVIGGLGVMRRRMHRVAV
ncbi:MAG: PEP-CTERM sorting domain-containing protein [Gemmataceae bacterium]|nr:PEP-CTERM sorting domain-containing protein [Gemmata sp.]MDW8199335.1 PEP-CTERM sorting domain-containing protein [Gemmataceae bacterium]